MPEPVVFNENVELLGWVDEINHRFVPLDSGNVAVKTEVIISGHKFAVNTVSHPPHTKMHGAMVSNINDALERVEDAIRNGGISKLLRARPNSILMEQVPVSFAEKDPEDD